MNWDIKGCHDQCINCHKAFSDGAYYYCRLLMDTEGPRREDYCQECWQKLKQGKSPDTYSYWQGIFRVRPEPIKEEDKIEEPLLKRLLKKWFNSKERLHQCFCYIIALILERNKTFQARPSIKADQGAEQLVYEDRDTGETYIIDDPGLSLKELNTIEKQLQDMMKQEFGANKKA